MTSTERQNVWTIDDIEHNSYKRVARLRCERGAGAGMTAVLAHEDDRVTVAFRFEGALPHACAEAARLAAVAWDYAGDCARGLCAVYFGLAEELL